ncbi:MAG: FeoC-like transcriptional regulator [Candidatus Thiodiazotropha sp.]|nr:FeoC-like transcriptional regulator [Candidatus Thiodiazotropha sp.]MCM8883639.1 FeoC-like transcriptional regulator [Candidatus Thiodiazotropha sp.]
MMLSNIRDYLAKRGQATLMEIALHVDAEPDAVRGMLQQWVRKGRVEQRKVEAACGSSCNRCDPASVELYVWREKDC